MALTKSNTCKKSRFSSPVPQIVKTSELAIKTGIDEFENQASGELSGWLVQQGIAPCESLEYEQIVGSKDDNVRLDWNVPLSPRLKKIESLCEIAVWLVPLLCWIWIGWNLRPAQ